MISAVNQLKAIFSTLLNPAIHQLYYLSQTWTRKCNNYRA